MLKDVKLYLLDMDGTLYFEDELIPGALQFIKALQSKNKNFCYLTNNSSKNKEDYLKKLHKLGLPCSDKQIFTSGMAMGLFLKNKHPDKTIYLVGTKALAEELSSYGIKITTDKPDIVVVGFDRELNYQKLELACGFLFDGAEFLATNVDKVCPMKNKRYIPDCGSICDMLEVATKKNPYYIGKPSKEMILTIASEYKIDPREVVIIGDRIYTDVATAKNAGAKSILVLSGETKKEDVINSPIKPDYVVDSVAALIEKL